MHCFKIENSIPIKKVSVERFYKNREQSLHDNPIFQEGYEKGKQDAEGFFNMQLVEYRNELASLHEMLSKNLSEKYDAMVKEAQQRIPVVILALLKKIWAHLDWDGQSVKSMIDQALMAYLPGESPLEVYLSPNDLAMFEELNVKLTYDGIAFKEDLSLKRGDCLIKSRLGILDARVDTKFKRIEEEFVGNRN